MIKPSDLESAGSILAIGMQVKLSRLFIGFSNTIRMLVTPRSVGNHSLRQRRAKVSYRRFSSRIQIHVRIYH